MNVELPTARPGGPNGISIRRSVWLLGAVLTILAGVAQGQTLPPSGGEGHIQQRESSDTARRHLREGKLVLALQSLEAMADSTPSLLADDRDSLSPTCAALHRALNSLGSDERYELLRKWTLSIEGPAKIRMLTALVPTLTPPAEFARALGERPRENAFSVATIGNVPGIFSTASSLVVAARDSGRLKRLIADLEPLVEKNVPNADLLMNLAQLADGRGDMSKPAERLRRHANQLKQPQPATKSGPLIDPAAVVLAAAALQHPTLRPAAEDLFAAMLSRTEDRSLDRLRPFLLRAHVTAQLDVHNNLEANSIFAPRWKYWIPVSESLTQPSRHATAAPIWLSHEEHILHLSGSETDLLLFQYPLQGEFQFECEAQAGSGIEADGGLVYGGQQVYPSGTGANLTMSVAGLGSVESRFSPFLHLSSRPAFNRWSISTGISQAGQATPVTVAINGHPLWRGQSKVQPGPWLGIRSSDASRPLFRNLKLTGQPVIPRTVNLVSENESRGWQHSDSWRLAGGEILVPQREANAKATVVEDLLMYQRPLLTGESITYEFFYEPGVHEVSPALGRVAFLLQPDGVRIHWVTDGDREWTGLTADNAVTEPLNRRGPRPVPFKMKDWNRVAFTRSDQGVTVSLNDVTVYQRPVDWSGDHRFGLYHRSTANGGRVRNVVMTGDWPETVPQEFLEHPTATTDTPSTAVRHTLNTLFHEDCVAENVFAIRRRALEMPVAQRFDFLTRWILPGPDHAGFRMSADFTQTEPAPPAFAPGVASPQHGGQIVSPVFDWLDAARELDRLAECRERVKDASAPDIDFQRRARSALLLLLSLEMKDQPAITTESEKLHAYLRAQSPASVEDQWPETLVVDRGTRKFADNAAVSEIIGSIYAQRTYHYRPPGLQLWHTHIAALRGKMQMRTGTGSVLAPEWVPVTPGTSATCGQGYPNPLWNRVDHDVVKLSGHDENYLFYRLPLSGNFEVQCELIPPGHYSSHVMIAGRYFGLHGDYKSLETGTLRTGAPGLPVQPPLTVFGPWVRYRGIVRDGTRTIFLNGQQVHTEALPTHPDPWIAIRSWGRLQCLVRDLKITGKPTVPEVVRLSESSELTGWIRYHKETAGEWQHVQNPESGHEIVSRRNPALSGMVAESLLRYQRPLVEDGTVEYDFFYDPGVVESHPALDRLTFQLRSSGVQEHWVTDGGDDRTELSPGNTSSVAKNRRGPADLLLKPGGWNHLKLALLNSTATVEVNGQLVYERELEPSNRRTFGLFHDAGETALRVRNIQMRGEWPRSLPPVTEQGLADPTAVNLDADLSRLTSTFSHSFQKEGLPNKFFKVALAPGATIIPHPDGIRLVQSANGQGVVTVFVPRCSLEGDFDIEAGFTRLDLESRSQDAGLLLVATLNGPRRPLCGLTRLVSENGQHVSTQALSQLQADGSRPWQADSTPCGSGSGRLRLARRGEKIYYLFAEEDSDTFRIFRTEVVTSGRIERDSLKLQSICNGVGKCDVVWKNLILRAERMTWFSDPLDPATVLNYLDVDGDGRLSESEYAASGDSPKLLHRDFVIQDLDGDGYVSLREFAPFVNGMEGHQRGTLPDPIERLVDQALADADRSLSDWHEHPEDERDARAFIQVVSTLFDNLIPPQAITDADLDRNGKVSRAEAQRFLEVQLGLRLPDGTKLRSPNGMVNNFSYFVHIDGNHSNQLERSEFHSRAGQGNKSEATFVEADKDRNGVVSIAEWCAIPWTTYDPVWDFRDLDSNLDGTLDTDELIKKTPVWKMTGMRQLVKAFDSNNDGKMSLDEYRLSPHSNMILVWQKSQQDLDGDGRLSIQEFAIDRPWFQALRSVYFRRFDQNHDGFLDSTEYDFTKAVIKRPREIYRLAADGTGLKKLSIGSIVGKSIGSPAVSHDGKYVAFDAMMDEFTVLQIPIDGGEPTSLGHGTQPTWSPDGKQFATRRFRPQAGSWIVDLNRKEEQYLIAGWGTQWSPDGKTIFAMSDYPGTELILYDLQSKSVSTVFNKRDTEYTAFNFNAAWSPDSRRLSLVATRPNTEQALLILDLSVRGKDKLKVRHETKQIGADTAWHPAGRRLVCSIYCVERNRMQLYDLDPDGNTPPRLISGQPQDLDAIDMAWTPDGKHLIFVAGDN